MINRRSVLCSLLILLCSASFADDKPAETDSQSRISFHRQVKPILQARCQGCHQPARANGHYVMTDFARLLAGGESEEAAVIPGKPEDSNLMKQIQLVDGSAAMPPKGKPLDSSEVEIIQAWILQGAVDDTPASAVKQITKDNPPIYTSAPTVTSLDFSPDGQLLAVAGFHEVLLHKADGSELVDRLVGLSERIESVRFSPDGQRLAVTGGQPGRIGEVQVWDVAKRELLLSHVVTFDTVYGASWSPDGKLIAFGCADNSVRAINAETGEQVLFQGAHSDWVRDTVFTVENEALHLLSVGRDMTVKLTEVETNRFVDNVTSITPGALKGGVNSIDRHPERDEIVVGGADGVPKIYRVFRITARQIGDDSNLIRQLNPMTGRVFGVRVSPDGKRIAAVSSLDGKGEAAVYSYEFDTAVPDDIKAISGKRVANRSAEEQKKLDEFRSRDIKRIADVKIDNSALYAVAFHPGSRQIAVAGGDGQIRLIDTETGDIARTFSSVPLRETESNGRSQDLAELQWTDSPMTQPESLPDGMQIQKLTVQPEAITLRDPFEYAQLLVTADLSNGDRIDVTRIARLTPDNDAIVVSKSGFVRATANAESKVSVSVGGQTASVNVAATGISEPFVADFVHHVNPVLSRVGCNQGTCHGAAKGKNGFKLSLRGYDPIYDIRAFTDDLAGRRTNTASPSDSLMLLKAVGTVPHVGGQLFSERSNYYEIVRNWVANGAKLRLDSPRVTSIAISPQNPLIQQIGATQQIRVVATYADGTSRDVTREAFIESGNSEVAVANRWALMTAVRRGESPVLARYEGSYAATTLTVMGDRSGFEWKAPETWTPVDELVAEKWQRMKISPSGLCTDAEFLRRVHLDLTGLPPSPEQVQAFLNDNRPTREKRDQVIDALVGSPDYVEYWSNKWADLLQVNSKFLGPEGAKSFRDWIRQQVSNNTPYDQFAREIITADGSNKDHPQASYFKILRDPADIMENTTHLFLGVRFNCNKCHDHPFERWTQDQYYQTAAYFARTGLKADPASGNRKIGGTAVEGAKPFYEIVFEKNDGEVIHDRTGQVTAPQFPYTCDFKAPENSNRRQELAAWITSPDNRYFATSYVNRLWGYLLGVGIMEPIDDLRAGNPPTNPRLLAWLEEQFIQSGFNVQHVVKQICKSRTYQLSLQTNRWNEDDQQNYSHAIARRLPAEVLFDSIHQVLGAKSKVPGVPEGTRAAAIPDAGIGPADGFLANLGRPVRESACECERSADLQLGPIMALIGGPTVGSALDDAQNALPGLVSETGDDRELVNRLFLRILNRPATDQEISRSLELMSTIDEGHAQLKNSLQEREAWWAQEQPKLEAARKAAIAEATENLAAYEKEIAPRREQEEKARLEKLASVQADFDQYVANLPKHAEAYLAKNNSDTEWHFLEPSQLTGPSGIRLERLEDRSVRASGSADRGAYTIVAKTSLKGIAAIRVEAMSDSTIKGNGPGLPENGNFVVTEFEVQAAAVDKPKELRNIALKNPKADFLQSGFNVGLTVDGNKGNQNGWAVANAGGVTHWATFEIKEPISQEGDVLLRFTIHQNHNAAGHLLGRFRISVSQTASPGLSLPEQLKSVAVVAEKDRSDQQKDVLVNWFRLSDATMVTKQTALNEAKRPLPEDPGVTQRKEQLAFVSQEVQLDSRLARLRDDVQYSQKQMEAKRLTAAQDIAWALINTPAFLFNH
ncbi:MAG: DUF1549 domain-containing protein [Planctomycetaceae bacterium]|nr:DUF1549 domain-containing protein [Planctomycetaceae bacterium]